MTKNLTVTGLSDACRRHTVTLVGRSPRDRRTDSLTTYDPATGIETETVTSSTGPTVIRRSLHGVLLSTETSGETTVNSSDALARVAQTWRAAVSAATGTTGVPPAGGSGVSPLQAFTYSPSGDLLATHTFTNDTDILAETYAYDLLGNRIATTDAHGSTTYRTYDPLGNLTVEWGATYPVRYTYDTQNRRTSLTTFRTTGGSQLAATDGDTTTWTYDPFTGNCLSKTYADGSSVTYTYTPDNLLLRTTYASGKWKENVYDAQRRLCGVVYSSPDMDYELQLDEYGNATNVQDATGNSWRYDYGFNSRLLSEEYITTGGTRSCASASTNGLSRSYDSFDRPIGYTLTVNGEPKGCIGYAYNDDGDLTHITTTNAAGRSFTVAYTNNAGYNYGYTITMPNGNTIRRVVDRDDCRRSLVTNCATYFNSSPVDSNAYAFDALSRPTARTSGRTGCQPVQSSFAYNDRSEVLSAAIGTNLFTHAYDDIGNHLLFGDNATTNTFTHNQVNQMVGRGVLDAPPTTTFTYTPDGGLVSDGTWTYAYGVEDQLTSVTSSSLTNGAIRVSNTYDYRRRRTSKTVQRLHVTSAPPPAPPSEEVWETVEKRTFVYDDWNLIHETISVIDGGTTNITEVQYFWGVDLSDSLQGAGGVGGLLAVSHNGQFYFPAYDNNGNVTKYIDEFGNVVAAYEYDDFGRTISQVGSLADFFRHRFSTKYYDAEIGLYYYGYRFYHPSLMRWLNRDPIEEDGGVNLYVICENNPVDAYDELGLWTATAESSGQRRRVYKFEEGDTMKSLAKKVGLDPNEYQKWGRVEKSVKAEKKTSVSVSSNTNPGCYVSVPNVWVEADLLRGGNVWNRVVNIGGTVGSFLGTTLGRYGYHFEHPHTMKDFLIAISGSGKDLYGLTVYAHGVVNKVGEPTGEFGGPKGPFVSQSVLLGMIHGKGYKIAEANMMQCYSWAKIKRNGGTVDFEKKWREVAVKPFGYVGINALGIDFGGRK